MGGNRAPKKAVIEAKVHFSTVMRDVEVGEVVVVTRPGKPAIELRSVAGRPTPQVGAQADPSAPHLEVNWTDDELGELFDALG